jgi:hypothetical protein
MKKYILLLSLVALLFNCKKDADVEPTDPKEAAAKSRTIGGEWIADKGGAGGTGYYESFKNVQYSFDVGFEDQIVTIDLSAIDKIKVQFALFEPNGTRIDATSLNTSVQKEYKLKIGKYRLVVCGERRAVGKFQFIITGIIGNPVIIPSEIIKSDTQEWGALGGGGLDKTFKNHFYTFDITDDNSTIDLELESADTEVALYLYDNLGQRVFVEYGSRYEFKVIAAKKGTYTVMVATAKRSSIGKYLMRLQGKVNNIKRVESQVITVSGRWANKDAEDIYSFRTTSTANAPLDIEVASPDANPYIYLQSSVGSNLELKVLPNRLNFMVSRDYAQGTYRIRLIPGGNREFGNYTLTLHGQFTDFKKL